LLTIIAEAGELASLRKVLAGSARGQGAIDEIETVFDFASVTAARPHLTFDVALARGLGYYTGCIFEIAVAGVPGSLGGGGRYDGLIGMFLNKEVPACGLSLGLERILVLMDERNMYPAHFERIDAVVAPVEERDMKAALALCEQLRAEKLRVDLLPKSSAPGKLRKLVDEQDLPAAVWLEAGASERASVWTKNDGLTRADQTAEQITALLKEHREYT
jgi:histidyl-tRNA synthetase